MKRTKLRIKEVKRNAKQGLGNYYGKAVGATVILTAISLVLVFAVMLPVFAVAGAQGMTEYTQTEALVGQTQAVAPTTTDVMTEEDAQMMSVIATSYPALFAVIILLLAPLQLGYHRFFLRSREGDSKVGTIFSFFKKGYWRSVGFFALYMLKTWCWAMVGYLMMIPSIVVIALSTGEGMDAETVETMTVVGAVLMIAGMIGMFILLFNKAYKYMMGMYALADNPEMSVSDAFRVGKIVAKKNVGKLFCLELSYFFWYLLAGLVPGLGELLVMPLVQAGMTEGYVFLKSAAIDRGELSAADFPQLAAGESSELVAANGETAVAEN